MINNPSMNFNINRQKYNYLENKSPMTSGRAHHAVNKSYNDYNFNKDNSIDMNRSYCEEDNQYIP